MPEKRARSSTIITEVVDAVTPCIGGGYAELSRVEVSFGELRAQGDGEVWDISLWFDMPMAHGNVIKALDNHFEECFDERGGIQGTNATIYPDGKISTTIIYDGDHPNGGWPAGDKTYRERHR